MIVILKNVRLSYPDLHKRGNPPKDKPTELGKYGGQFIIDPNSDAAKLAKEAMTKSAQEVFGPNWQTILGAMEKSKKCLRRGDDNLTKDGAIRDGYKDMLYIVARNKAKPLLIGSNRTAPKGTTDERVSDGFPILTEESGKPYGGCYVNVKVDIKAMKAFDNVPNQVHATLLTVQFAGEGQAFGSAPGTAEGFDDAEPGAAGAADDGLGL